MREGKIPARTVLPPASDAPFRDLAVRLNDMDLQRAVEQAAIGMALFAEGRDINKHRESAHRVALALMLGYMAHSWCRGAIVHKDYQYRRGGTRKVWDALAETRNGDGSFGVAPGRDVIDHIIEALRARVGIDSQDGEIRRIAAMLEDEAARAVQDWSLEFVLSPVDGTRAFLDGRDSGSISVIGAARPGTFPEPDEVVSDYLVIAVKRSSLPEGKTLLDIVEEGGLLSKERIIRKGRGVFRGVDVEMARLEADRRNRELEKKNQISTLQAFLQSLVTLLKENLGSPHRVRSWATSTGEREDFNFSKVRKALWKEFKLRTFHGSSVAAGLTPFFRHLMVDGYVGAIRCNHTILIAIGAKAAEGSILAIPLKKHSKKDNYELMPDAPLLQADDFVKKEEDGKDKDAFLVATGISENILVEGVRFRTDQLVSTQTLSMRIGTRASRFITHHHDLLKKPLRLLHRRFDFLEDFLDHIEGHKLGTDEQGRPRKLDRRYFPVPPRPRRQRKESRTGKATSKQKKKDSPF